MNLKFKCQNVFSFLKKFRLEVGTKAMDILIHVLETDRFVWKIILHVTVYPALFKMFKKIWTFISQMDFSYWVVC